MCLSFRKSMRSSLIKPEAKQFSKMSYRSPQNTNRHQLVSTTKKQQQGKQLIGGYLVQLNTTQQSKYERQASSIDQESQMKQPYQVNFKVKENTITKTIYKKLYEQVLDQETSMILSKLQGQLDGIFQLVAGRDTSGCMKDQMNVVEDQVLNKQMMESQNELKSLMSETAALQEGIDQINEQLRRPNPIRVNCLEQMDFVLV